MNSLFRRVFLTYWAVFVLAIVGVALVSVFVRPQPMFQLWMTRSLDLYGDTAADLYEHGGELRLRQYLSDIENTSGISGTLLQDNQNVGGRPLPPGSDDIITQAARSDQLTISPYKRWLVAIPLQRGSTRYIFVAQVHPIRRFAGVLHPGVALLRLSVASLIALVLCALLARSITAPIRKLQTAARKIAQGDFSARAAMSLGKRKDEVGLLAQDFDRMASRIQFLMEQQKLLLRDISHELRSPLARMSVSAALIQRGDREAAGHLSTDIATLDRMITNLLDLARIDALDKPSRAQTISLGALLKQIVQDASFEGLPNQKSVVQKGLSDLAITGDPDLLHSCIENVIRNAIKFTPQGSAVEVALCATVHNENRYASISVSDQGPGIPESAIPYVFDPFFRVPGKENHRTSGTGLGLSVSKRIVELHGGTILARNRQEGGLCVRIDLPTT